MVKKVLFLTFALLVAAAGAAAWSAWRVTQPLVQEARTVSVNGPSARQMVAQLRSQNVAVPPLVSEVILRFLGADKLKAGVYDVPAGASTLDILQKLLRGEIKLIAVRIVEGATFREIRAAMHANEFLKHDLKDKTDGQVMQEIGLAGLSPEARFFPDTYHVNPNVTESAVLKIAATAMKKKLDQVWAQREPSVPLKSADEALNLASIIEKETGLDKDRPMVSAVFNNRLRIGMRLQTDPTIIYGLGESFDGNLKKVHLQTDGPYNTYTRTGLPPTPIAAPSQASLSAAVQPAKSDALYFVARGDGTSVFSKTLAEHNKAVNQYQK